MPTLSRKEKFYFIVKQRFIIYKNVFEMSVYKSRQCAVYIFVDSIKTDCSVQVSRGYVRIFPRLSVKI